MKITPIQLAKRIEKWQHRLTLLGVAHWRIDEVVLCAETVAGPGAGVSVSYPSTYDNCRFEFTYEFLEGADEQRLDEVIIHEWLHVAFRDFDEATKMAKDWMPPASYTDFEARLDHEREGIVDRLSKALYASYHATCQNC